MCLCACVRVCVCVCVCVQTKGELSCERKEKCETMQHGFHKLLQTTQTLAVSYFSSDELLSLEIYSP